MLPLLIDWQCFLDIRHEPIYIIKRLMESDLIIGTGNLITSKFRCRNCESPQASIVYKDLPDRFHGQPGKFDYVRCDQCSLLQLKKIPGNISDYYSGYRLHGEETLLYRMFRRLMIRSYPLQKKFGRGRVLDIGCGNGWFISAMADRGWDAYGYEPLSSYAEELSKKLNLKIFSDDDIEKDYDNFFDLVTLNFSLEHLADPKKILRRVKQMLKQGGMISITVPNGEGLEARLFKGKWFHLDPPRHICIFSKELLKSVLDDLGFNDIKVRNEAIPTGFAGSFSYVAVGSFSPIIWYLSMIPGVVFSALVRDGNYTMQATM